MEVHGSKRFCHAAYLQGLCEKGDNRLKIANRNGNKLLRISKGYLCVLIFVIVLDLQQRSCKERFKLDWLHRVGKGFILCNEVSVKENGEW